jgi:hypothetical protein
VTAMILADFSDVAQTPHPVFGVPIGVGLLIMALYKLFKSNDSISSDNRRDNLGYKLPPSIDRTKYGEHEFNEHGFCKKCRWEKAYLVKMNWSDCKERRLCDVEKI